MYTPNKNKNIEKVYIDLYNKNTQIDPTKWLDILDYFKYKNVEFIFNYNSLKYKWIMDILYYLSTTINTTTFLIDHYKDIDILTDINFPCTICVKFDSDFSIKYRKKLLDTNSNLLFNNIIDINDSQIYTFCDVFVNSDNIYSLYETLKIFSKYKFISNVIFYECLNSAYYNTYHKVDKNNTVRNDINTQLILDKILSDNNILLRNKIQMMYVLNNGFQTRCSLNEKYDRLYISSDLKVKLCNRIDITLVDDVFSIIDGCQFNDNGKKIINEKYIQYCNGCSCYDSMKGLE